MNVSEMKTVMKINFNVKSAKAWAALASAVIGAGVSILTALGIVVKPTDATTLYSTVTAVLSLLTAAGILTDTNKPTGGDQVEKLLNENQKLKEKEANK